MISYLPGQAESPAWNRNRNRLWPIIDFGEAVGYDFKMHYPREDDPQAVMKTVGPVLPAILEESVQTGFYNFSRSRANDPMGFAELTDCSKANILYDRMAAVARDLIDTLGDDNTAWRMSENRRSTEIYSGPFFAFRIKRSKANRQGRSTGVRTVRQRSIKPSHGGYFPSQMVLEYNEVPAIVPDQDRFWLTVAYDLDDVEENIARVRIGRELLERWDWGVPLVQSELDVIASISSPLADRISDLRERRLA